jgi:serine phosphatase RsbU (regulator of sigma subunit)
VRQLSSLHQIGSVMTQVHNFDKLLDLITKQTLEVVEADSAWLMMKKKNSSSFKLAASSQVPANLMNMIKSNNYSELLNRISEMKSPLILNDLQRVKNVPADKLSKKIGGSLTGVPLMSTSRGIAGIIFAYKEMEYGFDQEDSEMIQAYANQTMIAIENSILFDESLERERLQQELNVAREIQLKLLPKEIPQMSDNIKIEAVSIPAYEVGGDYYDFIKLTETWGIYVGDVSGKSVSAALYMAELKGFVQSLARLYHSPKELMIKVNETLFPNIDRRSFISLLAAVIDLEKNKIKFTRAGHTPLGYYDPETEEWKMLRPEGLGLGLDKGGIFNRIIEEWEINFVPGCTLFFYTDGVTEVFNRENEEFGDERLFSTLEQCQKNDVSSYKDVILDELKSFSQENKPDDITMVIIKYVDSEKGN